VGGGEVRPRDQLGLARRLERRLGPPEGGARSVSGERAKLGSPEKTVVAGVRQALRHQSRGGTIGTSRLGLKAFFHQTSAISAKNVVTVAVGGN